MDGYQGRELAAPAPMPLAARQYPQTSATLQDAWAALVRRRVLALSVFGAVLFIGAALTFLQPRVYQATALLMMSPREPTGVTMQQDQQRITPPDSGYVDSQVEILRSPALAEQLVERLDLMHDREWNPGMGQSPDDRGDVVRRVSRAIASQRSGQNYVVAVSALSHDSAKAARMANTLVDLYLTSRARARIDSAQRTSDWLTHRLDELRGDLAQKEAAVQTYRAQNGLLMVGNVSLTEQEIQDAEQAMVTARVDEAERMARMRQARNLAARGGSGDTISGALTSDVMVQLRQREADVDRRLAEYSDRYGDQHPTVIAARAEKEDIERQIAAEVGRLQENLRNEAEIARVRTGALAGHLAGVRGQLVQNNAQMVRLNELERDATAARTVYQTFLQRYNELADGAAGVGGDAQLIAGATAPTKPAIRPIPLMLALSVMLALIAGALCALVAERFGTSLNTAEDVEQKIGLPILSTIPKLMGRDLNALPAMESHPGGFVAARPRSAFAEAFRLLRLRIVRNKTTSGVKVVAICSSLPGEGKTSTALCLARVAAMAKHKVILLDCDLRGRALNVVLGIEPTVGILEVLRGEADWHTAIGADEASGAHVLPAAGDCFTSETVFSSDNFHRLLDELRRSYDLIVLDCPPVLTLAEARDIAVMADGAVLVARRGRTSLQALRTAVSELDEVGVNIIGAALNAVDPNVPGRASYSDPLYFTQAQKGMYTT